MHSPTIRLTLATLVGLAAAIMPFPLHAQTDDDRRSTTFRVLTFNILYGGAKADSVGFADRDFGGSRIDEIVDVIALSNATIVGIQEDASGDEWHRKTNPGVWHYGLQSSAGG